MTRLNRRLPTQPPMFIIFALSLLLPFYVPAGQENREVVQKTLDEACESARERKLAPLREEFVGECVRARGKDRAYCERFYRDYGGRSGDRAPLFYDLPECVEAFEYERSYRRAK